MVIVFASFVYCVLFSGCGGRGGGGARVERHSSGGGKFSATIDWNIYSGISAKNRKIINCVSYVCSFVFELPKPVQDVMVEWGKSVTTKPGVVLEGYTRPIVDDHNIRFFEQIEKTNNNCVIVEIIVPQPEIDDDNDDIKKPIGYNWLKQFQRISIPGEVREPKILESRYEYEVEGMKWFVKQCPKKNQAYGEIRYKNFAAINARVTVDTSSQKKEDFTAIIEWNIMGEIDQKKLKIITDEDLRGSDYISFVLPSNIENTMRRFGQAMAMKAKKF